MKSEHRQHGTRLFNLKICWLLAKPFKSIGKSKEGPGYKIRFHVYCLQDAFGNFSWENIFLPVKMKMSLW